MEKPNISRREEANAITCWAFRNGFIEDLHAGYRSKLLENDKLSRITDPEMKKLMIQSSEVMTRILELRENNPDEYWERMGYFLRCSRNWDTSAVTPFPKTPQVDVSEFMKWRAAR